MKEERMAILEMIEDGKISAEDGVKLLNALAGTKKSADFEDTVSKATKSVDNFARDVKEKVSCKAKELKPMAKNTARVVVEKTASVVDDLASILKEMGTNLKASIDGESDSEVYDETTPREN